MFRLNAEDWWLILSSTARRTGPWQSAGQLFFRNVDTLKPEKNECQKTADASKTKTFA